MKAPRVTEPALGAIRGALVVFVTIGLSASPGGCAPVERRDLALELSLPADPRCRPETGEIPDLLEIRALGDFPIDVARNWAFLRPEGQRVAIDRFPPETQAFWFVASVARVDALRWDGFGFGVPDDEERVRVMLLPANQACDLPNPVAATEGSAALSLPDGGFVLAGGALESGGGLGTSRFRWFLPTGRELLVPELRDPRFGATLTLAGDFLVIAGGGRARTGSGSQTVWLRDRLSGARVGDPIVLPIPIREHAAIALDDGTVLLVGGRENAEVATLLDTAVVVDPATRTVTELDPLPEPRLEAALLRLDDGTIILAGGAGASGRSVRRFDEATRRFVDAGELPFSGEVQVVALPGARAFVIPEQTSDARAALLLSDEGRLEVVELALLPELQDLQGVRAAHVGDGRVLITGERRTTPTAHSYDPVRGTLLTWDIVRTPRHLLSTDLGTIGAFDDDGLALFATTAAGGRGEPPPAEVLPRDFALDAPGHWREEDGRLEALVDGARAVFSGGSEESHSGLRFRAVELSLRSSAELDIEFRSMDRRVVIEANTDGLAIGSCRVPWRPDRGFRVRYSAEEIVLSQGDEEAICPSNTLDQPAAIEIEARAGASLRDVRVERL